MKHSHALFLVNLFLVAGSFILASCGMKTGFREAVVYSPDSALRVKCMIADTLEHQFYYSIEFNNKPILLPSGFELDLQGAGPLKSNLKITNVRNESVNENWERVWGKRKTVRNHYNQLVIELQETVKPRRILNLYFRAYNDGVAFRYELPVQRELDTLVLTNEKIDFCFSEDHTVWAAFWNTFHLSQETEFTKTTIREIKPGNIIGTPLLINAGDNAWLAILEANVTNWACSGFTADPGHANTLISRPSWLPDDTTVIVRASEQRFSPWKVIMIADQPTALVESDLLQNLNEPCALDDVSWIRPGVSAWDWWWCGSFAPDAGFKLGSNTQTMKYFIDFAAEMGWQYQLVDWQWYGPPFKADGSFNTDADITKMIPEIDIPELVKYAANKNVKIILWLLWPNVDKQMEEAFALYEQWGVAGVKIDFMDRNDQDMVNFYHRVAKTAAKHHLVVDFHGAYVPDGFSRTYPNLITREGVLGNEYNKWSNRITPEHCLTLPFTRMLAGEMDFTPGGFLNDRPDQFKVVGADNPAPHVMGTRCFQLAMMVVYESAFQVFCESPYNVRNQPGSDFLKGIPSSWDETKVLTGMPGEYIIVARRSGDNWYMGGMSVNKRKFTLKTDFLDDAGYHAITWADAKDSDINPRKLDKKEIAVIKNSEMSFDVAQGGGFVAILKKDLE
ncbi:MAG: glycoside hydrolase family 97 protein [Bacteroidales bacterium]|nr:glycoside hydrolase family 97 protein [Bacteroidales bacterium]